MANHGFPKQSRLLSAKDFSPVFSTPARKISSRYILVLAKTNPESPGRLGLVVAKKHIRSAVQRNRMKRIIRESFRVRKADFGTIDLVVLVRGGLDKLQNDQIRSHMDALLDELKDKLHKQTTA